MKSGTYQTDCWVSLAGSPVPRRGAAAAGRQTNVFDLQCGLLPEISATQTFHFDFLFLRVWDNNCAARIPPNASSL